MLLNSEKIKERIEILDDYLTHHGYYSFDPYDGLSSPIARLFNGSQMAARIWLQAVRLFPINIRPLIGIKKIDHTKALSDFASAYCRLHQSLPTEELEKKAKDLLEQLLARRSPTRQGYGWGLRFPFATRFVNASADQANVFQTINAVHAFLDGYETFGERRYLEIAEKGFEFLECDLGYVETEESIYWKYWENFEVEIYNVSGLMIGLSARMCHFTHAEKYLIFTRKLYHYIRNSQHPDGSWPYSADERGTFIDGFHTGYILEGISRAIILGILHKDKAYEKGVDFYLNNFFNEKGLPQYYPGASYPIDGQNSAQALQTLFFILNVNFAVKNQIDECFSQIDGMLFNEKGFYNYQATKWFIYKTPMHRWVTGPMFLALAYLNNLNHERSNGQYRIHPE